MAQKKSKVSSTEDLVYSFLSRYENLVTAKDYKNKLNTLLRQANLSQNEKGLAAYLKNPVSNYEIMLKNYPALTTRRTMLSVILAAISDKESPEYKQFHKYHVNVTRFVEALAKKNQATAAQKEKYVGFSDIEAKYKQLALNNPHKTLANSQQFVLLSMVTSIPPKRADFRSICIYKTYQGETSEENYLVLRATGQPYFVFNSYKTHKTYGEIKEPLPPQLEADVRESLRRWPRAHLFVNRFGNPFANNQGYAEWVQRQFEILFGKRTGVSLIRHIYISEKLDLHKMNDEKLEKVARQMMHSKDMQRVYRWGHLQPAAAAPP
jgi:hypothetical protein